MWKTDRFSTGSKGKTFAGGLRCLGTQPNRLCERFVQVSDGEAGTLYYGWSFNGDQAHCREGYTGAEAALEHLKDVGPLLEEAQKIAELTTLEIHGPDEELAKLRSPLADLKVEFFTLKYGFRR